MEIKKNTNEEIYLLVQQIKKGDEIAFSTIMKKYRKSVYFLILKMVNNPNDAEDLTIEVFSKVFYNINMYSDTNAFSTWLFRIASNHVIDFIRKKKRRENTLNIDQPINKDTNYFFEPRSEDPGPEQLLITKQNKQKIKKLINILPKDLKEVIKLRVEEELTYKEIAEVIDQPINTVKARLYRGKNLLVGMIKQQ